MCESSHIVKLMDDCMRTFCFVSLQKIYDCSGGDDEVTVLCVVVVVIIIIIVVPCAQTLQD